MKRRNFKFCGSDFLKKLATFSTFKIQKTKKEQVPYLKETANYKYLKFMLGLLKLSLKNKGNLRNGNKEFKFFKSIRVKA